MGIKRYYATSDNTITNAYKENLETRGTGSNMGASDILEAFVIHGQTSASISAENAEQSRILIQFDINEILSDISNNVVPSSSVDYVLRLYNAEHAQTTPLSYSLDVSMIKEYGWNEGTGLDMENYSDLGESNWINATPTQAWDLAGGDYYGVKSNLSSIHSASYFFTGGVENLELNINFAMDKWRTDPLNTYPNYGLIVKHTDPVISGALGTYYTKKFFSRTSQFFLSRPCIEARWNSSRKDNRGNFAISSSLIAGEDNINTLFLYNQARGQLQNIPGLVGNTMKVEIFSGSGSPTGNSLELVDKWTGKSGFFLTGGLLVENGIEYTGIYTCSFASTLTGTTAGETPTTGTYYDVWTTGSGANQITFNIGSFVPSTLQAKELIYNAEYNTTITNLKNSYVQGQKPRLRVFTRKKDWSPNIFTVATQEVPVEIIDSVYYRVFRTSDNYDVIPFGTGSAVKNYSKLSYDLSGSYFELDTSLLETGYTYGIQFSFDINGNYQNQKEIFKFRIDDELQ